MIWKRRALVAAAMIVAAAPPRPAQVATVVNDTIVPKLIQEGMQRSHVEPDLEYLTDVIGPRLTGSAGVRRANDWTRQKFLEYGMDHAELEPWKFGVGWTRGPMTLRMTAPQQRQLLGVSWAWSPGTNGPLAGDVVFMDAHADSTRLDSLRKANQPRTDDERTFTRYRENLLWSENLAGLIRDGGKEFGLFTMSGTPLGISPHPQIVISNDDYSQFQRLIRRGERVAIEADIKNTVTTNELTQYNTVAEIRGSDKADEVVLLGAHLDSWDLATGATDNGTGAIAVLEAARILKAVGARPSRTIRFALFSGEEEGLLGSRGYVDLHKSELAKIQAVLVLDNGTGRITGVGLQGRDELKDMWTSMFAPLAELGPLAARSERK